MKTLLLTGFFFSISKYSAVSIFLWLINSYTCVFVNKSFVLLHSAASEDAMYSFAPVNWVNVAPANTLCEQTNTRNVHSQTT